MNYYDKYVELCKLLCNDNDYLDKKKVRQHNKAMDKIALLRKEIKNSNNLFIMKELLNHSDPRVAKSAAAFCLQEKTYADTAIEVLRNILKSSPDPTHRLSAEYILAQHLNCAPWEVELYIK